MESELEEKMIDPKRSGGRAALPTQQCKIIKGKLVTSLDKFVLMMIIIIVCLRELKVSL